MAYGSTSTPVGGAERQSSARLGAAGLAVCCVAAVAILSQPNNLAPVAVFSHVETATQLLNTWDADLTAIEKAHSRLSELRSVLNDNSVSLPESQKTDENTCLNNVLRGLMDGFTNETARNREVIGAAFKDEKTGKDDYSNARNEAALKDVSCEC